MVTTELPTLDLQVVNSKPDFTNIDMISRPEGGKMPQNYPNMCGSKQTRALT